MDGGVEVRVKEVCTPAARIDEEVEIARKIEYFKMRVCAQGPAQAAKVQRRRKCTRALFKRAARTWPEV